MPVFEKIKRYGDRPMWPKNPTIGNDPAKQHSINVDVVMYRVSRDKQAEARVMSTLGIESDFGKDHEKNLRNALLRADPMTVWELRRGLGR